MTELAKVEKIFEGHPITAYLWENKPVWVAKELGRVMGYSEEGKGLVGLLRQEWKAEVIDSRDVQVLEGEQLARFKESLGGNTPQADISPFAPSLLLLTESGFNLVCLKTDKPIGVRLRRWLAEEVMPSLVRTGSYQTNQHPKTLEDLRPAAMLGLSRAAEKGQKWAIQMVLGMGQQKTSGVLPALPGGRKIPYTSKFAGFFEQADTQEFLLKNFDEKWFFAIDLIRALDATKPWSPQGWHGSTAKSLSKYLVGAVASGEGFAPYKLIRRETRNRILQFRIVKP